eukprot:TRINITY_DN9274_c0_g1_i2.p1 TRINITY_DN9274_c0_g1~~TRINITY_DN9274_c0_g1_i2.p1  ORF type:complete len:144 (+),score=25.43 TRINITY_DN9274_c0_g1_i2:132-563(+)
MILDDATLNLDPLTELMFLKIIEKEFTETTMLIITSRLSVIADCDKVAYFDDGRIVEYNHPFLLMVNDTMDKSITNTNGQFSQMLLSQPEESEIIFEASRKHYFNTDVKQIKDRLFNELRRIVKFKLATVSYTHLTLPTIYSV